MKMTKEDFEKVKRAVKEVIDENPNMQAEYERLDLTPMRYRWDVLWLSGFKITSLYHYLNDDHIDTALRRIVGA